VFRGHDLVQFTPEQMDALRKTIPTPTDWKRWSDPQEAPPTGTALDMLAREYSQSKPHLRLRVKRGKATGHIYWAVLAKDAPIEDVRRWQVSDAFAMAHAKRCMSMGLPVR
jgi:hypothetical protein